MSTTDISPAQQLTFDIFVTALEGGIGYWSAAVTYHWSLPDYAGEDVLGFYADIVPADDDSEVLEHGFIWHGTPVRIDAKVIRRGIRRITEQKEHHVDLRKRLIAAAFDPEDADFDAWDADSIVQWGLFGEDVFS